METAYLTRALSLAAGATCTIDTPLTVLGCRTNHDVKNLLHVVEHEIGCQGVIPHSADDIRNARTGDLVQFIQKKLS